MYTPNDKIEPSHEDNILYNDICKRENIIGTTNLVRSGFQIFNESDNSFINERRK